MLFVSDTALRKAMVSAEYRIEDINQAIDDIENRRNNIIKAVLSFK